MPNNKLIKVDIAVNAPLATVWKWLFSPDNLRRLVDFPISADLHATGHGCYSGTVMLDTTRFDTTVKPHDITFSASGHLLGIRVTEVGRGCRVLLACSTPEGRRALYTEPCMRTTLHRLKALVENSAPRSFSYDDTPTVPGSSPAVEAPARGSDSLAGFTAYSDPPAPRLSAPPPVSYGSDRTRATGVFWVRALGAVLSLLLCFAAIAAGILFVPRLLQRWPASTVTASLPPDLSDSVTMDLAVTLTPGTSEDTIVELFGTTGIEQDGARVYRSSRMDGAGQPIVQVKVNYVDGVAQRITCLDLSSSTAVGALNVSSIPAAYGDTLEAMEAAAGVSVSMVRRWVDEGGEHTEYHFGYLDPFANFSPEWRGEIVVTMNAADGSSHVRNWIGYDGSDPLMVRSLEGEAVAFQYDNYDEFLHDKYQFDYSMLLLNRYSRGDLRAVFGEHIAYDGGGGFEFHYLDSVERITQPDGSETPLWRMTFGLNTKGQFMVGSYLNMRLAAREGTLQGCRPSAVAPGMTYSEVREHLPILPAALYVNESGFMLCYGLRSDKTATEDQFEFVVSFGIDNLVESVHDNMGMNAQGSISTNDPEANTGA